MLHKNKEKKSTDIFSHANIFYPIVIEIPVDFFPVCVNTSTIKYAPMKTHFQKNPNPNHIIRKHFWLWGLLISYSKASHS